mgnify:CR=1 FL=1
MIDVARMPDAKRSELFAATARKMRLPEAIVEKDFWVCYTLDALFHRSPFRGRMVFKGGTSLSKGFGLIQRFSEDVDLILDRRLLGYGIDEPWEERSNSKQERFKQETIKRTNRFLAQEFAPALRQVMEGDLERTLAVYPGGDEETVMFEYPKVFSSPATLGAIRLEVGPLAAWTPSSPVSITPYAAEQFPRVFARASTVVSTADPARTFWEKATILHQEANRPADKKMPKRYARHYYDLYRLDARWQLEDIDYYSAIDGDGDGAAFVEWAEKFPEDMPYDYLEIAITVDGDGARRIVAHSFGSRSRQLLCVWANDSKSRLGKCQL